MTSPQTPLLKKERGSKEINSIHENKFQKSNNLYFKNGVATCAFEV
jgi:hypothetical protein